jgi:hypothetical protein
MIFQHDAIRGKEERGSFFFIEGVFYVDSDDTRLDELS